jgi:hypothetical protein
MSSDCHWESGGCMEGSAKPIKACTTYSADECRMDPDAKDRCLVCTDGNGIESCNDKSAPCACSQTCAGCCDAAGKCHASALTTCGTEGRQCRNCRVVGDSPCTDGECRCGQNAACADGQACNGSDVCETCQAPQPNACFSVTLGVAVCTDQRWCCLEHTCTAGC